MAAIASTPSSTLALRDARARSLGSSPLRTLTVGGGVIRRSLAATSASKPRAQADNASGNSEARDGSTDKHAVAPRRETALLSVAPVPIAALAAAEGLREALEPVGELVRSWGLPYWLVHWGHPGNMAVVLFAMGGYGTYLGWQLRTATGEEVRAKAKDAHPKIMAGMFFFFALGATGGLTSLVTQGRPIFDSPHAYTGLIGLALLTVQTLLASSFKEKPELRSVHAYLGSATMALFLVHAALGLNLGLSF